MNQEKVDSFCKTKILEREVNCQLKKKCCKKYKKFGVYCKKCPKV